jgi:hypothetical protein
MAVLLALAVDIASAGIVVDRTVTAASAAPPSRETHEKVIVQDDKELFQINDQQSVVIDADAASVTAIDRGRKIFRELPFRKVMGTTFDPNRFLYLPFKSTGKFRRILGLKCQDYVGEKIRGPLITSVTACFSSDAPGSEEFSHFMKAVVQRLGRRAEGVAVPEGFPLVVEVTHAINPSFTLAGVPPKELLRFRQRIARIPPQVTREEVTKLSSKKLAPDLFRVPLGYKRIGPLPD